MMDEQSLLCRCLHDGKITAQELTPDITEGMPAEVNVGVPAGTVVTFLQAICETYGSCAVLAIEEGDEEGWDEIQGRAI